MLKKTIEITQRQFDQVDEAFAVIAPSHDCCVHGLIKSNLGPRQAIFWFLCDLVDIGSNRALLLLPHRTIAHDRPTPATPSNDYIPLAVLYINCYRWSR